MNIRVSFILFRFFFFSFRAIVEIVSRTHLFKVRHFDILAHCACFCSILISFGQPVTRQLAIKPFKIAGVGLHILVAHFINRQLAFDLFKWFSQNHVVFNMLYVLVVDYDGFVLLGIILCFVQIAVLDANFEAVVEQLALAGTKGEHFPFWVIAQRMK